MAIPEPFMVWKPEEISLLNQDDEGDDKEVEIVKECGSDLLAKMTAAERCEYIRATENEAGQEYTEDECKNEHFQFNELYYCGFYNSFGEKLMNWFFWPVGLFIMFILMRLLATTADEYLSPSLEYMTVKFGISESLAGVTLLAFGNGAPDLFTAMSAGSSNALTTMSPLLGSALFISCVVVCLSLFAAKPDFRIRVTSGLFLRDLSIFILMEVYLMIILLFIGKISIFITCSFALIYIVYVVMVVY
jgi:solute carrier family 24 (sodium/potassium/calcium exchanger), member 6